jgi:hypothetical protein
MGNPQLVEIVERRAELKPQADHLTGWKRAPLIEQAGEGGALYVLENEVRHRIVHSRLEKSLD